MIVGNRVKALMPCDGLKSIRFERGKIIYLGQRALVEFDRIICGHDGNGLGARRRCWMMDLDKLEVLPQGDEPMAADKEQPAGKSRGLFEIHVINLTDDKVVYTEKVVADSEANALYESDVKAKLKELGIKKDDTHIVIEEIGSVPPKEKPHVVKFLDKVCDFVTGKANQN